MRISKPCTFRFLTSLTEARVLEVEHDALHSRDYEITGFTFRLQQHIAKCSGPDITAGWKLLSHNFSHLKLGLKACGWASECCEGRLRWSPSSGVTLWTVGRLQEAACSNLRGLCDPWPGRRGWPNHPTHSLWKAPFELLWKTRSTQAVTCLSRP